MANQAHETTIRRLYPSAKEVKYLASGDISDVYLVDTMYTIRFPRNIEAKRELSYECELLKILEGKVELTIPKVVAVSHGEYAVMTYVAGNTLKNGAIKAFSAEKKQLFARQIADFIINLNAEVSTDDIKNLQTCLQPDFQPYVEYFEGICKLARDMSSAEAKKFMHHIEVIKQQLRDAPLYVIHGDLHAGNLLFNGTDLHGVLDFGDCTLGSIYDELSPLYSLGEDIISDITERLTSVFDEINIQIVRSHAIAHELSVLIRLNSSPERIKVAQNLLREWGEV